MSQNIELNYPPSVSPVLDTGGHSPAIWLIFSGLSSQSTGQPRGERPRESRDMDFYTQIK